LAFKALLFCISDGPEVNMQRTTTRLNSGGGGGGDGGGGGAK
jgi:hypothetical protein